MVRLDGVFTPVTTPFIGDKLSINKFHENLELLSKHKLNGIVLFGSNGEAVLLHEMEKIQMLKAARLVTSDDKALIAGTGGESINATTRLSNIAADYGADALLILTPHYYKKFMTDDALVTFFTSVANKVKLPVIIYNMPAITGVTISPKAVAALSQHEKIIGIKDSSGNMSYLEELIQATPDDFKVMCGNASIFASALIAGASAGILGVANVIPEPLVQIYNLVKEDKIAEAISLQQKLLATIKAIIGDNGVSGVKAAMTMRGLNGGVARLPLLPCSDTVKRHIDEEIQGLVNKGIIKDKNINS